MTTPTTHPEPKYAVGQDGAPMGKTFTVLGSDEESATTHAFEVAHTSGYHAVGVLALELVEAGWWDVTVSYLATSPAVRPPTSFPEALARLAREYGIAAFVVYQDGFGRTVTKARSLSSIGPDEELIAVQLVVAR